MTSRRPELELAAAAPAPRLAALEQLTGTGEQAAVRRSGLALQRSLLPTDVPSTEELEVVARYAAAEGDTEAAGDWYDVIPLGAGRLALVVGDVMGRGVPAAAVMGQLRTAVRTCARLDLRPGEVLDVLDGLLRDLDQDAIATCVYAAFDPHTRELCLASAGHRPPVLRDGGGAVQVLSLDVGAPLGLADPPRETAVRLLPGSVVALYTDGLADADGEVDGLCEVVAGPHGELDALADAVVHRGRRSGRDDLALLLARVPDDVDDRSRTVVVHVPRERALLFDVRDRARRAMRSWALLDAVVETATLVATELVTNALVHGRGAVDLRLRLTRDRLVLEAVDGGSHLPRRRRAGEEDEGGRGLQLVASLASRWGSRAVDGGKVVWAELDLARPG